MRKAALVPCALAALAVCGCNALFPFKSELDLTVQVRSHQGIVPVDVVPSAAPVLAASERSAAACDRLDARLGALADATDAAVDCAEAVTKRAGELFKEEAAGQKYADNAKTYAGDVADALSDLAALPADATDDALKAAVETAAKRGLDTKGKVKYAGAKIEAEQVRGILYRTLYDALAADQRSVLDAAFLLIGSDPDERRAEFDALKAESDRTHVKLSDLAATVRTKTLPTGDAAVSQKQADAEVPAKAIENGRARTKALRASLAGDEHAVAKKALDQAVAALRALASKKPRAGVDELVGAATDVQTAVETRCAASARSVKDARAEESLAAWLHVGSELPSAAAAGIDKPLRARLVAALAKIGAPSKGNRLADFLADVEAVRGAYVKFLNEAAAVAGAAPNPVAQIRGAPMRTADPNLPAIVDGTTETEWRAVPIDLAHVAGDGSSQYIIVQDAPTSYRVKEVHVDPTKVNELQMQFADAAVAVLGTAARAATGLPIPKAGQSANAAATTPPSGDQGDDAQTQREFADDASRALREVARDLAALRRDAGAQGADAAKIRNRVAATLKRLQARIDAALAAAPPAPAAPTAPAAPADGSGGTGGAAGK